MVLSSREKELIKTIIMIFLVGLLMGVIMSFVSNGFVYGVAWITNYRENLSLLNFNFLGFDGSLAPLLCLLLAAVTVIGIKKLFSISRYHGPADSIFAAHRADNDLEWKPGIGSTLAAFVSASGGASVGQYGPLVHFGATVGSLIKKISGGVLSTEIFLGCGVAGAIAAGFNAPITGVVFAHEAILRHFSQKAIAPIAISSITAAAISEWAFGGEHLFDLSLVAPDLVSLLPMLIISGPIFGVVAIIFMVSLRKSAKFAVNSKFTPNQLILLAAFICGTFGMYFPEVLGLGTTTVSQIFDDSFDLTFLLTILLLKIFLSALCIGFGLFGGVFSPALFVGAAAGGVITKIFGILNINFLGHALAICGMAAVGAAVIGAPISTVLIVLEMTGSYEYAVAAMLAVVTCKIFSNVFYGHSFFDRQLMDRGVDISQGRGHIKLMEMKALDIVSSTKFVKVNHGKSVKEVIDIMVINGNSEAYVTDEKNTYISKLSLQDIVKKNPKKIEECFEKNPVIIFNDDSVLKCIEKASKFVGESIPVLDKKTKKITGVITEADLFQAYLKLQTKIRSSETD